MSAQPRTPRSGLTHPGAGRHLYRATSTGSSRVAPDLIADEVRGLATRVLKGLVRLYQLTLSPFIGGQCRFHPTCSDYALEVLERHGPLAGSWLAVRRLLKCHPLHPGGTDLPPSNRG